MAAPANTNYRLLVSRDSICIADFWIPFEKPEYYELKDNSTVEVSFGSAMGIAENVVIEFKLLTAKKVDEFVQGLLRNTKVKLRSDSPPKSPLYTISRWAMSKIEYSESFKEYADIEWARVYSIYSELAERFPRIKAASAFFLYAYSLLERIDQLKYPYGIEIIKNAYKYLTKTPLKPEEEEIFLSLGGQSLRQPAEEKTASKS